MRPLGRTPSKCAWCGKPAAAITEVRLSGIEPGKARGEALGSRTRRLCSDHALLLAYLLEYGSRVPTRIDSLKPFVGLK